MFNARFAVLAACVTIAACGGGGDEGDDVLVRSSQTITDPDQSNRFRNGWTQSIGSESSAQQYTGDLRWRACVTGTLRQSLTSPGKLKLTVSVFGNRPSIVEGVQGVVGQDNRINFSACGETFTKAVLPTRLSGSGSIQLSATDLAGSVDGYDITAHWVVTKLP